jgi:hypothetical protein
MPAFANTSTLGAILFAIAMIELQKVKTYLNKLEEFMYGHNYEIVLGIEVFDNCASYVAFAERLKILFPDATPEDHNPVSCDLENVVVAISAGLDYCGDTGAGPALNETLIEEVKEYKANYLGFIHNFAAGVSTAFSYPDETGIPGYPVWWDYRFIIINDKKECLFTYGAASD